MKLMIEFAAAIPLDVTAETIDLLGTVFIAFAALRVHHRVLNEHRVDNKVFREMRREQVVGVAGVFLVIISYAMKVFWIL